MNCCRADEESKNCAQLLAESNSADICGLRRHREKQDKAVANPRKSPIESTGEHVQKNSVKHSCSNCGLQHPKRQCPAYGKQCQECKKLNHFTKCCKSTKHKTESVQQCESTTGTDTMFVGTIEHKNKTELTSDECHTTLEVEGHSVKFKVDTGSQINI